jgi:hypothetical protein
MENPVLAGVRAKISRADKHFQEIDAAVMALQPTDNTPQTPPYTYTERQELIITSPPPQPLDPMAPLAVGDYFHNLRSALDHLVFQLAILNGAGQDSASKTMFPVYLTAKKFHNFTDRYVTPFISATALAEIEKLQPYAAGNAGRDDILWVLSQLDIIDKHRLIVVLAQQFRPIHVTATVPTREMFDFDIPNGKWKPLEDGAEIIRFDLSNAIRKPGKVNVRFQTAKTIKLSNTGLVCDEFDLDLVLSDCRTVVSNIINSFGNMFFGE